jgi:hypothetical protein
MAKMEIAVDDRGRTSLARVRRRLYRRYSVAELDDGTLVLSPLVTVSPAELSALRDPAVTEAVAAAREVPDPDENRRLRVRDVQGRREQ